MHEVLVNRLGGLSLPRKSVVRLTDHPHHVTMDVKQQKNNNNQFVRENKLKSDSDPELKVPALALMDILGIFTSKKTTLKTDIKGIFRLPK